jgi:hypothetical protein
MRAWQAFLAAVALLDRRLDQQLKEESGLSHPQSEILVRLAAAPGGELRMTDAMAVSARSPAASAPPMIDPVLYGQGGTVRTPGEVRMSRMNTNGNASATVASQIRQYAQQAAEAAKPIAAQVKPLASDAKEAAGRGVYKARAWAAPQVERSGQVLQDSVAPKVAAALHSSAERLNPGEPPHRGWRKGAAAISILLAAAAAAVAAVARSRKARAATNGEEAAPAADEAQASADGEVKDSSPTTSSS